jgi:hypothetical protein
MNNIKKDIKFYLFSFLLVAFFAVLPPVASKLILVPHSLSVDFMYLIFYYLIYFILFLVSILLLFLGWGKGKIKNRKIFLIYFSLLFLVTFLFAANWVGDIFLGALRSPMSFPG